MNIIDDIRSPVWNGGKPHIGIADFKIKDGLNKVELTYVRKKDGRRSYPNPYFIDGAKARTFPVQVVTGGVKLHVIPISEFKEGIMLGDGKYHIPEKEEL